MGRPLTIKDEGVSLNSDVGSIDFVGGGVAGSAVGSDITETVTGMTTETPVGDINGTNTDFTVTNTPQQIFVNGMLMTETEDYTISGLTITFLTAPPTNSIIKSFY